MLELNDFEIDAVAGGTGLLMVPAMAVAFAGTLGMLAGAAGLLIPIVGPIVGLPIAAVGLTAFVAGVIGLAASIALPIL